MRANRWMLWGALALLCTSLYGSANAQDGRFATKKRAATQAAASAYWTPERMAAARPEPLVARQGLPTPATDSSELRTDGAAELIAGRGPGGGGATMSPTLKPFGGDEAPSALAAYFTYPFPFTRTEVNPSSLYTVYPWSTNGKLFFTKPGQGDFVCSATAVTSGSAPRRALVLTAGHCVSSGNGTFWTNFLFAPALRDLNRPFGTWDWEWATTTSEWHNNANSKRDVAFIVTSKRFDGRSLGNVVGDAGIGWNWPDKQDLWAHGYPSQAPFNGKRMILCTAAIAIRDTLAGVGPAPIGIGCDQTKGSSGGSWKRASTLTAAGYAIGVFSYKYTTQPQSSYSPYFDTAIRDLWTHAQTLVDP
jgi:V8-like Glu-specific endopeptidase